jgi:hypothetical protein
MLDKRSNPAQATATSAKRAASEQLRSAFALFSCQLFGNGSQLSVSHFGRACSVITTNSQVIVQNIRKNPFSSSNEYTVAVKINMGRTGHMRLGIHARST